MTPNDRNPRQTALSAFEDGERILADGGVTLTPPDKLAESAPAYEQPYTEGSSVYERLTDLNEHGIMYAEEYEWDSARCTAEAYGDKRATADPTDGPTLNRSLQFHTGWIDAETAKECVREIGGYNGFSSSHVAAAIDEMPDSAQYVVGREGSPVIYAWTDRAETLVDELEMSNPFATEAPDELAAYPNAEQYPQPQVESADAEPGRPMLVRAWWD